MIYADNIKRILFEKKIRVGNTGGMCSRNNVNKSTAYVVLDITHENNSWNDFVD